MSSRSIKIITINTWKSDGHYAQRMSVLTEQLQELDPDIVLCQECFALPDNTINTIQTIASALNLYSVFTPARLKRRQLNDDWKNSYSGLGIMSRFPISILKEFKFSFIPEDGERKVQIAIVDLPYNKKLVMINVHLTHLAGASASDLRSEQVRHLSQEVMKLDPATIRIVGGDFNAEINSPELNLLQAILMAKDCYALGNGKIPKDPPTAFQVQKSVDHVFILPDNNGRYPEFKNSAVVLNRQSKTLAMYPSDHPGIMTTAIID